MLGLSLFFGTDGSSPMSDAGVVAFYLPPGAPTCQQSLPLMGQGTTDANGDVTLSLNTSMVTSGPW